MSAQHAVAVRTQYYARAGRRALVVSDLASLRGAVPGHRRDAAAAVPERTSPVSGLEDSGMRRWLY